MHACPCPAAATQGLVYQHICIALARAYLLHATMKASISHDKVGKSIGTLVMWRLCCAMPPCFAEIPRYVEQAMPMYACEACTVQQADFESLESFQMRCLRKNCTLTLRHKARDEQILDICKIETVRDLFSYHHFQNDDFASNCYSIRWRQLTKTPWPAHQKLARLREKQN